MLSSPSNVVQHRAGVCTFSRATSRLKWCWRLERKYWFWTSFWGRKINQYLVTQKHFEQLECLNCFLGKGNGEKTSTGRIGGNQHFPPLVFKMLLLAVAWDDSSDISFNIFVLVRLVLVVKKATVSLALNESHSVVLTKHLTKKKKKKVGY